jgi:hypothetical protein
VQTIYAVSSSVVGSVILTALRGYCYVHVVQIISTVRVLPLQLRFRTKSSEM